MGCTRATLKLARLINPLMLSHLPTSPAIPVYFEWIKWVSYLNYTYAACELRATWVLPGLPGC